MQPLMIHSDHKLNNLLLQHHVNNLTNGVASPGSDDNAMPSPGKFVVSTPVRLSANGLPSPMVRQNLTRRIRGSFAGLFARKAGR